MDTKEIIGFLAAICTTGSFLPGAVKVWRKRPLPAESVSAVMFAMITAGTFGWFVYGILAKSPSVIWANGIAFPFAAAVLVYKFLYG